ncbi:GNAT family N-acetyltransferase [Alloscardovia criceti]|uniref:GNAT family N-acetyltransferase n=1 Tax=Alloscardovia criceti TaxID=356828 RepID=UPI00039E990B|nr:GNAT family N-acetyltransferase [Alloscardovia criceti]
MNQSVLVRPAEEKDFDQLSHIMFHTWYEMDMEQASAHTTQLLHALSRYDVAHYLETSTHALVAIDEAHSTAQQDHVLGVAMWRNDADWRAHISQKSVAASELQKIDNLRRMDADFEKMYQEFSEDAQRTVDLARHAAAQSEAELRLFMIASQARGRGVGKKLLSRAENSMRTSGARQYYLYTDSECDYSFYDYKGMKRVTQALQVPGPGGRTVDKFIYTQQLNK